MDRIQNCAECEYISIYDYGKRIYYCDHEDRIDDMGKIGTGGIPEMSPEWCPLRNNEEKQTVKTEIQEILITNSY